MIYFIEAGKSGPIKIGYSGTDAGVEERRKSHQTGNPNPLRVIRVIQGTRRGETTIHRALSGCRLEGEWFDRAPALALLETLTGEDVGGASDVKPRTLRAKSRLNPDFTWEGPLSLYWSFDGESITDDYTPREMPAWKLCDEWMDQYLIPASPKRRQMSIYWYITGPGFMEMAPIGNWALRDISPQDYYSSFHHPVDTDGVEVSWLDLPVVDKRWNRKQADKGGFIQELTGWKPSPFQQRMDAGIVFKAWAEWTRMAHSPVRELESVGATC